MSQGETSVKNTVGRSRKYSGSRFFSTQGVLDGNGSPGSGGGPSMGGDGGGGGDRETGVGVADSHGAGVTEAIGIAVGISGEPVDTGDVAQAGGGGAMKPVPGGGVIVDVNGRVGVKVTVAV
ncbi:MAG: hypothetical protein ACK2UO_15865, partial [Caldilineaceae bacterium]